MTSLHNADQDTAKEYTTNENTGKLVPEACTARFDIKSFVYRARYVIISFSTYKTLSYFTKISILQCFKATDE